MAKSKFDEALRFLKWESLPVYPSSQLALRKRADMVIAGKRRKAPRVLSVADGKMHLHRLECGQSLAIPYSDSYVYKDALKFRIIYYNKISGAYFKVVKHKDLDIFEIARLF